MLARDKACAAVNPTGPPPTTITLSGWLDMLVALARKRLMSEYQNQLNTNLFILHDSGSHSLFELLFEV